jgi:hypothetical protein
MGKMKYVSSMRLARGAVFLTLAGVGLAAVSPRILAEQPTTHSDSQNSTTFWRKELPREVYLGNRLDGLAGTGKPGDPYDASTAERFDGVLARYSEAGLQDVTFRLAPGVYRTRGCWKGWKSPWYPQDGWAFVGSGMGNTTIKLDRITYHPGTDYPEISVLTLMRGDRDLERCEVRDLTLDGSFSDFGSDLAEDFQVPAKDQTVTISVTKSEWARDHIGKLAYLQRREDNKPVGIFRIQDVPDASHIVLLSEGEKKYETNLPTGSPVMAKSRVYVGPALCVAGLWMAAKSCRVTRVRVTNVARPIYEGGIGILVGHATSHGSKIFPGGNQVTDCRVDGTWGRFGWLMAALSNDPALPVSCVWIGNQLAGNGHDIQGFGGYSWGDCLIQGNVVRGVVSAVYCDTGKSSRNSILSNVFADVHMGVAYGGSGRYWQWVICGNTIRASRNGIEGYGNTDGLVAAGNIMELLSPEAKAFNIAEQDVPLDRFENNVIIPFGTQKHPPQGVR